MNLSIPNERPRIWALDLSAWAMALAIGYGPLIVAIAAYLALAIGTFPLLFIPATVAIAGVLLRPVAAPTAGIASGSAASLLLGLFLLAMIATTLRAQLGEVRVDSDAMWRQLFLALLPAVLFWGARAWAATSFSVGAIDRGADILLAVCAASIGLEMLGLAQYEAFGSRYFGFVGDQVAWIISFLGVYYFVRGKLIWFAAGLVLLFATLSRAPLLIVLIGVAFQVLFTRTVDLRTFWIRFGTLLIGTAAWFIFEDAIAAFMERLYGLNLLENDRTRTIAFTLWVFDQSEIFGSGYNAHTYFFRPIQPAVNYTQQLWATPVSSWAQILADGGIVAFIPFALWTLVCLWTCLRTLRVRRSDREARALMALAAWFMAFVMFNHTAAWLLPSSLLSPLVFVTGGIVVGRSSAFLRAAEPREFRPPLRPAAAAPR